MAHDSDNSLSLVPLTDLCEEVMRRAHDGIIIINLKDVDIDEDCYYNWVGNSIMCLGLCQRMIEVINQDTLDEDYNV